MKVYRLSEMDHGTLMSVRYFRNETKALQETASAARVMEAMHEIKLIRNFVNQFGVVVVCTDRWPDATIEVRLEEGEVE